MYIRIAFSIELRLSVSRSLRSLANYRPSPLAQQPSNDVLACGDRITPSNRVKYHPSSITLISTEQRGGVRKRCNITPRNVHERFQTLLTPVLTLFTDFLSAVVTSEIAQILSLYGGGFLALKWQS